MDLYEQMTDDQLRDWIALGDHEADLELQAREYYAANPGARLIGRAEAEAAGLWFEGVPRKYQGRHPDDEATDETRFFDRYDTL